MGGDRAAAGREVLARYRFGLDYLSVCAVGDLYVAVTSLRDHVEHPPDARALVAVVDEYLTGHDKLLRSYHSAARGKLNLD